MDIYYMAKSTRASLSTMTTKPELHKEMFFHVWCESTWLAHPTPFGWTGTSGTPTLSQTLSPKIGVGPYWCFEAEWGQISAARLQHHDGKPETRRLEAVIGADPTHSHSLLVKYLNAPGYPSCLLLNGPGTACQYTLVACKDLKINFHFNRKLGSSNTTT